MALNKLEMNRRLIRLAEHPASRFWRVDYQQLSEPERVFLLLWELESEVNNGGFRQYFYNSSGALAPQVMEALKAIGAARTAHIAEQAVQSVAKNIQSWTDDATRQNAVDRLLPAAQQKLHQLDEEYYSCPDDLTLLLYEYVAQHRTEIGAPPEF